MVYSSDEAIRYHTKSALGSDWPCLTWFMSMPTQSAYRHHYGTCSVLELLFDVTLYKGTFN